MNNNHYFEESKEYNCGPKVKLTKRWERFLKEDYPILNSLLNYIPFENNLNDIHRALLMDHNLGRKKSFAHLYSLKEKGFINIDFPSRKVTIDDDFFIPEDFEDA